jgi:hypothetical protein
VSAFDAPGNSTILEFAQNGTVIACFKGMPPNCAARGLAFDAVGNLFVAEVGFGSPIGGAIQEFPSVGATPTSSPAPTPITFASGIGSQTNRGPEYLAFVPGSVTTTTMGSNITNLGAIGFATISVNSSVTAGGTTTVIPISPSAAGYTLPGSSLGFDITTTASFSTPIIIAFQVAPPLDVSTLTVFHNENGNFVNVTCPILGPGQLQTRRRTQFTQACPRSVRL